MAVLLSAHQLSKAFSARSLFESLTFAIESGERIGLIGPNGAGKSTLLKILAGLEGYDAGNLSLQRGLRVAYLAQVPTFRPDATVEDTLLEPLLDGAEPDWERMEKVREIRSRLELPDGLVEPLSGGWKKRVALGRELVRNPDLLLLDEPLEGLAPIIVDELLAALRRIVREEKMSAIIVEQSARKILPLTDRAIILERGAIAYAGASADLAQDSETLARLLGVAERTAA
jgi:branched-chain amino acid transport system ATP-binding protein